MYTVFDKTPAMLSGFVVSTYTSSKYLNRRVEDMARELEALKNKSNDECGAAISPSIAVKSTNESEGVADCFAAAMLDDSNLSSNTFQLGTFRIDKSSVIDCFRLFSEFFYPHFPILDRTISIFSMHASSPFLFWTIIAIVLSNHIRPAHASLFDMLEPIYKAQLGTEILTAPISLQNIQALAHLIMWPFAVDRQSSDSSWLYCGIVVHASLNMGLHHSKTTQSTRGTNIQPDHIRARASTWLACFFSSTTLSMFIGIFPSINSPSDLDIIEKFTREQYVQPEFAYLIMVQHTLAKFTSILQENSKDSINCSLIKVVITELDSLKTRFLTEWTARMEVTVLIAKLHLYTMTVLRVQSDLASRELLLKLGLSVSLRIVYLCDQGLAFESSRYHKLSVVELQHTLPKNYHRGLALATIFLLRYFALNDQATTEERDLARNHIAISHKYFKVGSLAPQDERARVAKLFETLSRQQPFDINKTKLKSENRMGWSLVVDSMKTGSEIREKSEQSTPTELPVTGNSSVDDAPLDWDNSMMSGFSPLDFSLPADIWGDSMWGML